MLNQDKFEYIRLSIIGSCNLRCRYCKPHGHSKENSRELLSVEDIIEILKFFIKLNTKKVRITGGEPLIRSDIGEIVSSLTTLPEIVDISITTNGILLEERLESLIYSGIKRINVSLPSIHPERYKNITGSKIEPVVRGIMLALASELEVKINMVVYGEDVFAELEKIINFISDKRIEWRFIEYMPMCSKVYNPEKYISANLIEEVLLEKFGFRGRRTIGQTVDTVYTRDDICGRIGFIRPVTKQFCSVCNKIRIGYKGDLRPCLFSNETINVLDVIRNNSFEIAQRIISSFVYNHNKVPDIKSILTGKSIPSIEMGEIGG